MTKDELINKWGYQTAVGYGPALFDVRDNLRKDVDELLKSYYTKEQILEAAKEGEVSMIDAKWIVEILDNGYFK